MVLAVAMLTWSAVFAFGGANSASALSYDSMYPTENTHWSCTGGSAAASNYCRTDNSTMTVFMQTSLSTATKSTVRSTLNSQYNPTDLNVTVQSAGVYSGSSETDVVYQVSTSGLSGTNLGMTWCDDAVSTVKCDQEYVRFRYTGIDSELACHETGHAVGLTHGAEAYPAQSNTASGLGCLETPDSTHRSTLGANNVSQINATY